jgi:hypothetical protein
MHAVRLPPVMDVKGRYSLGFAAIADGLAQSAMFAGR